jgi:WD40 repeat protein
MPRKSKLYLLFSGLFIIAGLLGGTRLCGADSRPAPPPGELPRAVKERSRPAGAILRLGSLRLRHPGFVYQLAFTARGRHLASLGADHYFRLWHTGTGQELLHYRIGERFEPVNPEPLEMRALQMRALQMQAMRMLMIRRAGAVGVVGAKEEVSALAPGNTAFSADGTLLTTTDFDQEIRLVDLNAGKVLRRLRSARAALTAIALAPDNRLLAGADLQGRIYLWDVATGKKLHESKEAREQFTGLYFSPNGAFLAGTLDTGVRLWDAKTGKRLRKYEGHEGPIAAVAFSGDSKRLASAAQDQTIRLWEVESEEELRKLSLGERLPMSLAFAPNGKTLAAGTASGAVQLWDLATGKEVRRYTGGTGAAMTLAFSPDGKTLAAGNSGGIIRLWETATGKERLPVENEGKVVAAAFSPDGREVLLGTDSGTHRRWDALRGRQLSRVCGRTATSSALAIAPGGQLLADIDEKGQVRLWDAIHGKAVRHLWAGEENPVTQLCYSGDGKVLAALRGGGPPRLWRVDTGKEIRYMRWPSSWTPQGPGMRVEMPSAPDGLAFAQAGNTLAARCADNTVRLWEVATGRERFHFRLNRGGASLLAFSPTGQCLATAGGDDLIRLWDPLSGKLLATLVGHEAEIHALAFSPDGKRLASGGDDKMIRVWDVAGGHLTHQLPGHEGAVLSLAFSPEGKTLLSGSTDTTALLWDLTAAPRLPASRASGPPPRPLADLWTDLGSTDAQLAFQALGALAERPGPAVGLLARRLKPRPAVQAERLAELVAGLDDARFGKRDRAMKQLEKLSGRAALAIQHALAKKASSPEVDRRLKQLVAKLEGPVTETEILRALRAVELLERIGSARARQLLATLARGAPEARLTRRAAGALQRLGKTAAAP